jgi:hypothetical protein
MISNFAVPSGISAVQDFERLLQDVNRTTMKAIQVYVDEVRQHGNSHAAAAAAALAGAGAILHQQLLKCTHVAAKY